ncbi:MAG: protein kinase domain-containing protein, partial [Gammaproteobacteria bacterium]
MVLIAETARARVWRAFRAADSRTVAIKMPMSAGMGETSTGRVPEAFARFRQGYGALLGQTIPGVMSVTELGEWNGAPFAVTEWLGGGNLADVCRAGIDLRTLADHVDVLGRALEGLHALGLVHGDLKPANVRFGYDGTPVLADPDLVLPVGAATGGADGSLLGTPNYMSPEQWSGAVASTAMDRYAFGCLLFELLVGVPPFDHPLPAVIGQRHDSDPVPRLPQHLEAFQGVIDTALAKRPEGRFTSAGALAAAFSSLARAVTLGPVVLRSEPVATLEIRAVGAALADDARHPEHRSRRRKLRSDPRVRVAVASVTLLLALAGLGTLIQRPDTVVGVLAILGVADDPVVAAAWDEARNLHRGLDPRLAVVAAAYRRVLALDPSFDRAERGLEDLASEWRTRIESTLADGRVADAEARLMEFVRVFPGDRAAPDLAARIDNRRAADASVDRASAALRLHGLDDPIAVDDAIRAYLSVLRRVPGHPVAQSELNRLAAAAAEQAALAIARDQVSTAIDRLDLAAAANADLPLLAAVRRDVLQTRAAREALDGLLLEARALRAKGALIDPERANAVDRYLRVLAVEPDNERALGSVEQAVTETIAELEAFLHEGDLVSAADRVARLIGLGLDRVSAAGIGVTVATALDRHDRIVLGLETARARFERGLITAPKNDSAVAALRAVLSVDP